MTLPNAQIEYLQCPEKPLTENRVLSEFCVRYDYDENGNEIFWSENIGCDESYETCAITVYHDTTDAYIQYGDVNCDGIIDSWF